MEMKKEQSSFIGALFIPGEKDGYEPDISPGGKFVCRADPAFRRRKLCQFMDIPA